MGPLAARLKRWQRLLARGAGLNGGWQVRFVHVYLNSASSPVCLSGLLCSFTAPYPVQGILPMFATPVGCELECLGYSLLVGCASAHPRV